MKAKRLVSILLACMMLAVLFSGCALVQKNEERDRQQIIATVNGQDITKGEFEIYFDNWRETDSQSAAFDFESEDPADVALIKKLRIAILQQMIYSKIMLQEAEKLGLAQLSAEQEAEIDQKIQTLIDNNVEYHKTKYNARITDDPGFDAETVAYQDFMDELAASGFTLESLRQLYVDQEIGTSLQAYVEGDITITDEEIKARYDALLEAQKLAFDKQDTATTEELSIAYAKAELEMAPDFDNDMYYDRVVTYYPTAKHVQVKHILIPFKAADAAQLLTLVTQDMDQEEALKEYAKLLEEAVKKIDDRASEVLEKVKNGEDFDKLIEEYGEDSGQKNYLDKGGYIVTADGTFASEFQDAALAFTEEGQTSEIVVTVNGCHILKCTKIFESGKVIPLDEVKDAIEELLLTARKETEWLIAVNEWVNASNIKIYDDRVN